VGLTRLAGRGAEISADAPLCLVHARDEGAAQAAATAIRAAYRIGDGPAVPHALVSQRIGSSA
jgi:thymidine phosphorylase